MRFGVLKLSNFNLLGNCMVWNLEIALGCLIDLPRAKSKGEVRVYNRALSASEIQRLYNMGR